MKTLIVCGALFLACTAHKILADSSYIKLAVGPTWNQIIAVDHFLAQPGNIPSNSILLGLDNPCALIQSVLKAQIYNSLFCKLIIEDVAGQRGYFTLINGQQIAPFSLQANYDGFLNTNVISLTFLGGVEWSIQDAIDFTASIGYNYARGNRTFDFTKVNMGLKLTDHYNGGGFQVTGKIHPTENTTVEAYYTFFLGPLGAKLFSFPGNGVTRFFTPQFTNHSLMLEYTYYFNQSSSVYIAASWLIGQNIKKFSTKASPSINAVMSKQFAPFFRSQFFTMLIGAKYNF